MKFKGWQKLSLIEWPNKICSIVFVGGCNLNCFWCQNKKLVEFPEKLPDIDEEEILNYLKENKNLLDGLMITGGEPLIQINHDLINFMKKIKVLDLKVGIETNGLNPNFIKYLIDNELVDYFAMDIKAPLEEEKYAQIVGKKISLKKIKESIKLIRQTKDYEFRTTLVPNFLNEEDVFKIAEEIKGAKRYFLQIYRNAEGREIYPENFDFKNLKEKLKNYFEVFSLRC